MPDVSSLSTIRFFFGASAGFVLKNEVIELWFLVSASRTRDFGGLGDGLLPYSQTLPLTLSVVPYPLLMAY